jgi:thymidylate kinase
VINDVKQEERQQVMLVAIEGLDGTGKTTVSDELAVALQGIGSRIVGFIRAVLRHFPATMRAIASRLGR